MTSLHEHPEYQALLRGLREDPSTAGRLIAADWFQEHGDEERAEFIRAKVAGVLMGGPRRYADGINPWPLERIQPLVSKWFSVKTEGLPDYQDAIALVAPAVCGMTLIDTIHWRGVFGSEATAGYIVHGMVEELSCAVSFLDAAMDWLYLREPVRKVRVTEWAAWDRKPFIENAGYDAKKQEVLYRVAGKPVTLSEREVLTMNRDGNHEKRLAQLVFAKRWPGVFFEVSI